MNAKDLIIALDFPDGRQVIKFLDMFQDKRPYVKVGMELYYAEGPQFVRQLKERGHKIFLDLKLHDIPNTVKSAMAVLGGLGVDMTNLHAAGTKAMMEAARDGLTEGYNKAKAAGLTDAPKAPLLIAVTQLTSTDEPRMKEELLISAALPDTVRHYAKNTRDTGLDGVVCSPLEAQLVKDALGPRFLTVTPGIRPQGGDVGDQRRVTTPGMARAFSDYIVVGRPITRAEDPVSAYDSMLAEFLGA